MKLKRVSPATEYFYKAFTMILHFENSGTLVTAVVATILNASMQTCMHCVVKVPYVTLRDGDLYIWSFVSQISNDPFWMMLDLPSNNVRHMLEGRKYDDLAVQGNMRTLCKARWVIAAV